MVFKVKSQKLKVKSKSKSKSALLPEVFTFDFSLLTFNLCRASRDIITMSQ